ncbi:hypothetical protein NG99_17900 [Erwinia typographi]|uniref:Uncharacterized protein n=1 Tax=Erwinia typographi TaxID=371042 RepID=A0A0A3YYX8_9GAMM|nr:hypothetical protein NG99_17900 [Erwinia typographi]
MTNKRPLLIQLLWIGTVFTLIPKIGLGSTNLTDKPVDLLAWLFMIIGIRSFYSGCFRFVDWFKGKS